MNRYIFAAFALFAVVWTASAQNINPQVEVTNDYRTDFSGLDKYDVSMIIPDSLLKFNLAFDYSVFDNPYKGSYEFSPYSIRLTPDKSVYDGGKFSMRLGAGYAVRPEFKLGWTMVNNEKSSLSLFQDLGGYYGDYYGDFKGFDLREKLGVSGRTILKKSDFIYSVAYDGMAVSSQTSVSPALYHTGRAGLTLKTSVPAEKTFYYELNLDYLFGLDYFCKNVMENAVRLYGTMAPIMHKRFRLKIDYDLDGQFYSNSWSGYAYNLRVLPRAEFTFGVLDLSAGVKLDVYELQQLSAKVYPDIRVSVVAVPDYLKIYAGYRGNVETYDYNRLKEMNHHLLFDLPRYGNTIAHSTTDMDAFAGFSGKIANHFQYDLSGGYRKYSNLPILSLNGYFFNKNMSGWFADASMVWNSERLDIDLNGHFAKTEVSSENVYNLPLVCGDMSVTYNWNKRFYAGVFCEASTKREAGTNLEGYKKSLDAFVNLGAQLECRFAGHWSVWLKGSNVLNSQIWKTPYYAEKGPSIVGGIGLYF